MPKRFKPKNKTKRIASGKDFAISLRQLGKRVKESGKVYKRIRKHPKPLSFDKDY